MFRQYQSGKKSASPDVPTDREVEAVLRCEGADAIHAAAARKRSLSQKSSRSPAALHTRTNLKRCKSDDGRGPVVPSL